MRQCITRRDFVRLGVAAGAATYTTSFCPHVAAGEQATLATPTLAQLAWQRAELGVLFSWDLHVFDGERSKLREYMVTPNPDPQMFAPTDYDIDQWFDAVKGMGARFAILTASHCTGFRLWQSDANPYCMKMLKWRDGKADIVKDFVEASRRHGIKPGIFMGCRFDPHRGIYSFKTTPRSTITQEAYNRMVEKECEEIATRYGELFEIWFDGGILTPADGGPDVLPIFEKHQPDILFYASKQRRDARWGGSETGTVPYPCWSTVKDPLDMDYPMMKHGNPAGAHWVPAMSDAPLRAHAGGHEWFWEPDSEKYVYPLKKLVSMYEQSVGHNSTLILGLTPDTRGRIPELDTRRCIEWGKEIRRRYGTPIARTSGTGTALTLELPEPATIDRVILMEHIAEGHRIRGYRIDGRGPGGEWLKLGAGTCVGNKRIQTFAPVGVSAVRVTVTDSVGPPRLDDLSVYRVG